MDSLPILYDIAMSPGGGMFLYACFITFLWYDTRKKLWAMVKDLECKVERMQGQYDQVLKEKIYYQMLAIYAKQARNNMTMNEALDRSKEALRESNESLSSARRPD